MIIGGRVHGVVHGGAGPRRYACHEMRNPLHAILALLDCILEFRQPPIEGDLRADVAAIQLSAASMQRLVNDILDLGKLRDGTLTIRPSRVSTSPRHMHRFA